MNSTPAIDALNALFLRAWDGNLAIYSLQLSHGSYEALESEMRRVAERLEPLTGKPWPRHPHIRVRTPWGECIVERAP